MEKNTTLQESINFYFESKRKSNNDKSHHINIKNVKFDWSFEKYLEELKFQEISTLKDNKIENMSRILNTN